MREMAKDSASPFTTAARSLPSSSWQPVKPTFTSNLSVATTSAIHASTSTSTPPPNPGSTPSKLQDGIRLSRKRKKLSAEEEELARQTSTAILMNLTSDHLLASYPDVDTPFEDQTDIVNRLLPYHVFQHPKADLDAARGLKGKAKATELDLLREEIRETKFAIECTQRFHKLQNRFGRARYKTGKHTSPNDQAIVLTQAVLEADRQATNTMELELASARSELDKMLRMKRIATSNANNRPPMASFTGYAGFTPNSAQRSQPAMGYAQYYSAYTYPYGQSNPYALPNAQPGTSTAATQPTSATTPSNASAPADQSNTPGTAQSQPSPIPASIPVQLPISSLPALQTLGILPIPKAAVPPPPQPQPPAVLLGSTNNGTMLILEINVGLLQAAQMSGLAIILSGLMQRSNALAANGTAGQGSANAAVANAPAAATSTQRPNNVAGRPKDEHDAGTDSH